MRWLVLYARSRRMPVSAAAVVLAALAAWALEQGGVKGAELHIAVMLLTASVAAASAGLGGQDTALDRTAAIRWLPRRVVHVLLIGAVAGAAALAAVQAAGHGTVPTALVVRDGAGLAGLAALGAVLCGAPFAWILPTGWLTFTLLVPPPGGTVGEVAAWMVLQPETALSTGTPWLLLGVGTLLYAVAGPRR
ncbi:hypothetical protein ACFYUY_12040 [Kitasatospora sp. NPDC004745]|uniref:hypothetical protein n=1 Tax=Kitasatospora sp. NPDC004745 TaxID=3364019 RepID=UPI00367BCABE